MAPSACCFVHASDLHLERPLYGLAQAPEHLREAFLVAPYLAAERVFETAVTEHADFVVLAGDVVDVELAGSRALAFLRTQFERLAAARIAVYWAGGKTDAHPCWPKSLPLPPNVTLLPRGRPLEYVIERAGTPVARLVGASREPGEAWRFAEFSVPRSDDLPTIGVAHAPLDALPSALGIDYWALGGNHAPSKSSAPDGPGGWSGTPQGRQPRETGPRGCHLVRLGELAPPHTALIACDLLRWQQPQIVVDPSTTRPDFERLLVERLRTLSLANEGVEQLVCWSVVGKGPLATALRQGQGKPEILARLNSEFGRGASAAWSLTLDVAPPDAFPEAWYTEDTILGDFMRAMRDPFAAGWADAETRLPDLTSYIAEELRAPAGALEELAPAMALAAGRSAEQVMREATALGADLLGGEGL